MRPELRSKLASVSQRVVKTIARKIIKHDGTFAVGTVQRCTNLVDLKKTANSCYKKIAFDAAENERRVESGKHVNHLQR